MENYVLYGEICKTGDAKLYKGRRKRTISYVGIYQYDCQLHSHVSNSVSLLHSLDHDNLVRFVEWYQSPQHIWVITELASGGTLANIMDSDGPVPVERMSSFLNDLTAGLSYVHEMRLLYCDFTPSKILLDAKGVLKLSDFSLAQHRDRVTNTWTAESIYSGVCQCYHSLTSETGKTSRALDKELTSKARRISSLTFFNPFYLAPEVFSSACFSTHSDLWSLGCVMYELMMGMPPFVGTSPDGLKEGVVHRLPWIPKVVRGFSGLWDIVSGLLQKNTEKRTDWTTLKENVTFNNLPTCRIK